MYNYRILSFIFFTSIFWGFEMAAAAAIWFTLSFTSEQPTKPDAATERPGTGSTQGQIPGTDGTATPLTPSSPGFKKEESPDVPIDLYPAATDGDVEDEDGGAVVVESGHGAHPSDSGIGTSMESSSTKREVRRRTSRGYLKEEE